MKGSEFFLMLSTDIELTFLRKERKKKKQSDPPLPTQECGKQDLQRTSAPLILWDGRTTGSRWELNLSRSRIFRLYERARVFIYTFPYQARTGLPVPCL